MVYKETLGQFQRIFGPNRMLIVDNNRSEKELVTITLKHGCEVYKKSIKINVTKLNSETMDRKRTTSEKKNMSFKNFIKESIIDIPRRRRYALSNGNGI